MVCNVLDFVVSKKSQFLPIVRADAEIKDPSCLKEWPCWVIWIFKAPIYLLKNCVNDSLQVLVSNVGIVG